MVVLSVVEDLVTKRVVAVALVEVLLVLVKLVVLIVLALILVEESVLETRF